MELLNRFIYYLNSLPKKPSRNTIKNYKADINQFIRFVEEEFKTKSDLVKTEFSPFFVTTQVLEIYKKAKTTYTSEESKATSEVTASDAGSSDGGRISHRSLERHLSSLRKFFGFLKSENLISVNPFESPITNHQSPITDLWRLQDFKRYLSDHNKSRLTIKNYILDIKSYIKWATEVTSENSSQPSSAGLRTIIFNTEYIEEYKNRLLEKGAAPRSINRKLSSLRQYLRWAIEKGFIDKQKTAVSGSLGARSGAVTKPFKSTSLDGSAMMRVTCLSSTLNVAQNDNSVKTCFGSGDAGSRTPGTLLDRQAPHHAIPTPSFTLSENKTIRQYSSIPPFRLLQKTLRLGGFILDKTIIYALSEAFDYADYLIWKLRGKPIMRKKMAQGVTLQKFLFKVTPSRRSNLSQETPFASSTPSGIPKGFYAPLEISIEGFPIHKKVFHLLRHTRPAWYKRYHSYAFSHYLHVAILVISMSIMGGYVYNHLSLRSSTQKDVLASLASPQVLSFQGRLLDNNNLAVDAPHKVRFALYNSPFASGSAMLWQEVDTIQPDKDGNFSVLLGNFATGGTPIAQTTLTDNPSLWVGVTVENDTETMPRQPLPTVGLASDTKTLQGLSPITKPITKAANVVLALDSSGNLSMTDNFDHTFQATGGQFKLSGKGIVLSTSPGTSSDIQLAPDGLGRIDLQKPITNSLGNVEVYDNVNILATSSAEAVLAINQDSTGPILTASAGGIPKFSINNEGGGFFAGNVGIGTQSGQSSLNILKVTSGSVLSLFTKTASESGGQAYETFGDTDSIERFRVGLNAAVPSSSRTGYDIVEASSGKSLLTVLKTGFVGIGTSSPADARLVVTNDGMSTGAAVKAVSALQSYASGDFQSTKYNTQVLLGGQYAATFTGGNVGIGTTSPKGYLDITSTLTDTPAATISANTSSPAMVVDNRGIGDIFTASSSGMPRFAIAQNGNVTIYGSSGTTCTIGNGTSGTSCSSDSRLKDNVAPLSSSLNKILALKPVSFNWKGNLGEGTKTGFIAQDVQQVFPEFVSELPNGYLGIDYAALVAPTIRAVQELASQGEALRGQVASLSSVIASDSAAIFFDIEGIASSPAFGGAPRNDDSAESSRDFEEQLSQIKARNYIIKTNTDRVINSIGGFAKPGTVWHLAKLVVGTVKAGLVETQDAIVHNTLLAQKVVSPLAEIDQIHTNVISPLSSSSVVIHLKSVRSSKFKVQSSEGKDLAIIDNQGNVYAEGSISARSATFSGQLSANSASLSGDLLASNIQTKEASIEGTLRVKKIIADSLSTSEGLEMSSSASAALAQGVTFPKETPFANNLTTSNVASQMQQLNNVNIGMGTFTQGLISLGPTSLNDVAIAGQLSIGNPIGGLILANNSINILGGGDLQLQPLRQGGVSIAGGNIYIDTDGNLKVSGNAHFAKDVSVKGVLAANIISPLPDQDLVIRFPSSVIASDSAAISNGIASSAFGDPRNDDKGKLLIKNASGSSVLAINSQGDLVASGSGTFNDLLSKGLTIVRSAQADTSLTETIATASAGTATIIQGETERTIITPFVKKGSLIYITPTSDTQGITPYIARQTSSSFTIQIPQRIYKDIKVNWWIVN